MVCANISSPSKGAGGSSDASGGSFRHSWASCMLEVIHEDQPWESQVPPTSTSHKTMSYNQHNHTEKKDYQEHVTQAVTVLWAYWFCPWVCMLSVAQWLQVCSDQWQALPMGLSLLYSEQNLPQSPEELRVTPAARLLPERQKWSVNVINHHIYHRGIKDKTFKKVGYLQFCLSHGHFQ